MAVVHNTLIGRARGSVGNATFTQWKGLNILKEKIAIMTNPRSANQQANRTRFTALLGFAKLWRPLLQIGFKEYAGTMSWMNRFMSVNSNNGFLTWDDNNGTWVPHNELVVISEGSLYPTVPIISDDSKTSIVITFDAEPINNQSGGDFVMSLLITPTETKFLIGSVIRDAGTFTFTATASTVGDPFYIITFFMSSDGRIVSNSIGLQGVLTA